MNSNDSSGKPVEIELLPSRFSLQSNSRQLSLVHEMEYEESKNDSPGKSHIKSSPKESCVKSTDNNEKIIKQSQKASEKSSENFVDYDFERKSEEEKAPEENENPPKETNSHFSPLVELKGKEKKSDESESEDLDDLEEENHALKLREEPCYKEYKTLIFPDDTFKEQWEMILAVMILYSCLWVPYYMAFIEQEELPTIIMDGLSDFIFLIDVVVNFNSAFFDDQDVLIVKRSQIALAYLKLWFWLDLTSALPFSLITEFAGSNKSLKFQKLIKMTRFLRIFKMIKERNRILKYLNSLLKMTSGGAENILGPIVVMACFCHVCACFYYMLVSAEDLPDTWIVNYYDSPDNEKYLASFYWVTQTVVTTGYGDIPCITTFERLFAICLMFIGVLVYSFSVGSLSNFLIALDEQNEVFNEKLMALYSMKHRYNLDFFLCKRIERFLRYGKKIQIREEQKSFVLELPKNLKIELSAIIYKNLIDGVEFFSNKPKRFMAFVCPYLKSIKFKKEDIVADEGDRANEIYFLKSGSVALILKQFDNFKFMKIAQGNYFGEVDLLFSKVRTYTFMAETDCELLSMTKQDFHKVFFKEFKEIGFELHRNAKQKQIQMKDQYEKAKCYCQRKSSRKTILLRKNTSIIEPPTEKAFYRKASIMSLSLNNKSESEQSDDDNEDQDESLSSAKKEKKLPRGSQKMNTLIKLHKVELDSASQISEKNDEKYQKQLEILENMQKIEGKINNVENIIQKFLTLYDEDFFKLSQNLSDLGDQKMESLDKLENKESLANGLETLSDGGDQRLPKEKNKFKEKRGNNFKSHFSKSKDI